jgi:adenine-specific DNA-methyltransferase
MDLPSGGKAPAGALLEWEVPFDFSEDWPAAARLAFDAFHEARQAMQRQMDASIAAHADQEVLYDHQSFWLMGQPDVEVRERKDGLYEVEVHGFDYFDTAKGDLVSGGKSKIALWLLDTDYDERSLFPRQVFFPMAGAKDGWFKLRKDIRAELDESRLDSFHGTVSLPFAAGENRKVAVKVVDDRGIESLKILRLG